MELSCRNCATPFAVTPADESFYSRMHVPLPTQCPRCRMQRRLSYRNDRALYRSTSALSGKSILSMYHPDNGFVVYDQHEWWSDAWDPLRFGRPFDFSKSFTEQFTALRKVVPRFALFNRDSENCDYVNYAPHNKSCYLVFGSWFNEDCYYGQTLNECKSCVDNLFLDRSELCYENIDCDGNYNAVFCQNSSGVSDSAFCFDCRNVNHCIGCWNLRSKEYHILNEPVSRAEYEAVRKQLSSYDGLAHFKSRFDEAVTARAIHQAMIGRGNEQVSGNFIFNCKNAHACYSLYRCEDVAYSSRMIEQTDTYDFEGGGKGQLVYESMSNDFSTSSIGCTTCESLYNTHYADLCFNCKDCFGCIGLQHKQYCILNTQYTQTEYESLLPRIIEHMKTRGEWGEFLPITESPFAYNETMAQEYFPLTKKQAIAKGYRWQDPEPSTEQITLPKLPDMITDVPASIVNEVIACVSCNARYKIVAQELAFYKRLQLPLPRQCHQCRHAARMAKRTPRHLWDRTCAKCNGMIRTAYAPERPENVYCESCYLETVY